MLSDLNKIQEVGMTVVLSGYLCGDELSFWKAFIEIQAKLPTNKAVRQIVAHSFNPELADLIELVYAPQVIEYEKREEFCAKIFKQIDSRDLYVSKVDYAGSATKDKSLRTALCNAYSRASAIRLINNSTPLNTQILMAYWDLRDSNSNKLNYIVTDSSLPTDYLYFSYTSDVDMGYSDAWMVAPWNIACRFGNFDQFALEAFTAQNKYLELFTKAGWPYPQRYSKGKNFLSSWYRRRVRSTSIKIVRKKLNNLEGNLKGDNFFRKFTRRLLRPINNILTKPPVTAENSCLAGIKYSRKVVPRYLFLNIRPLLKYFILFNGLRERVRFLTKEDFEIAGQSGQTINPQKIILLVFERCESSLKILAHSPMPIAGVYQLSHGLVHEYLPNNAGGWTQTILRPLSSMLKDQIGCALEASENHIKVSLPVVLTQNVNQFLKCTDWFYFNALMKYVVWKEIEYVQLKSASISQSNLNFPDLYKVQSNTFFLFPSAGSFSGIRSLLDSLSPQFTTCCECTSSFNFEFPMVSRVANLFENAECINA